MLIDALFNIVWRNFRKCSVEMVNQCSCFECTVSFIMSVANEMKDLENLDKRISNHGVLNPRISDKCINSSIFSYTAILICLWPLCSLFQEKLSFLFCQLQKIFHSVGCRGWLGSNHFNEFVKTSIFVKDIHWWCVLGKLGHYFWQKLTPLCILCAWLFISFLDAFIFLLFILFLFFVWCICWNYTSVCFSGNYWGIRCVFFWLNLFFCDVFSIRMIHLVINIKLVSNINLAQ